MMMKTGMIVSALETTMDYLSATDNLTATSRVASQKTKRHLTSAALDRQLRVRNHRRVLSIQLPQSLTRFEPNGLQDT